MTEFVLILLIASAAGYAIGALIGSLLRGDWSLPRIPVIDPAWRMLRNGMQVLMNAMSAVTTRIAHPRAGSQL